ncbi:squalene/phytoene synthase family protein [Roseospira navarrensis]|nr:squalene/phytoene synthase family protein [Roseospira navarrensis]
MPQKDPPEAGLSPSAALVRRHDRDRFVLALMAPAARREALFALFALAVELRRIPGLVSEPVLGVMRLQYWRDLIAAEDSQAAARGNPVAEALAREALPRLGPDGPALLETVLQGHADDLAPDPPVDATAARALAAATDGALAEAAALALGAETPASREAARHAGTAWGLAMLARNTPQAIRSGRLRLPTDAVMASGQDGAGILAGRDTDRVGIRAGVRALLDTAEAERATAGQAARHAERSARPVLRLSILAAQTCRVLRRADADPYDGRVALLRPPMLALLTAPLRGR